MKRLTALMLASLILLTGQWALGAENPPAVIVDGLYVDFEGHAPMTDDGTAMLPIRFTARAMGLKYSWYPARETAVLSNGDMSVELTAGQRVINLGSSVFIADRDMLASGGELYVSEATLVRLSLYFGYEAEADGLALSIDTKSTVIIVDGNVMKAPAPPIFRNDEIYFPTESLAMAMGLEQVLNKEDKLVILSQNVNSRNAVVDYDNNTVIVNDVSVDSGSYAFYESGRAYMDSASLLKLVEYFGGAGSFNKYKNRALISTDASRSVKVNGELVVFPDVQPSAEAVPLRPVAEAAGLTVDEGEASAVVTSADGTAVAFAANSEKITVTAGGRRTVRNADRPAEVTDERMTVSPQALRLMLEAFGMEAESGGLLMEITDPSAEPYSPVGLEKPLTVTLDGREIAFPDALPVVVEGRTLIPIRAVAEEMGMEVEWLGDSVLIENGGESLTLVIGSADMTGNRNGERVSVPLDVPAALIDNRTCVPIRAIMEFFGAAVGWDADNRTVIITSPQKPKEIVIRDAKDKEEFSTLLGFTIDAPIGAADVEYGVANENTAVVRYRTGNTFFSFRGASAKENAVMSDSDFSGARLSSKVTVNGTPTSIITGSAAGASAARWEIGSYSFSLAADGNIDDRAMLEEAKNAAATFVIVREIEPEPEEEIVFEYGMNSVEAAAAVDFERLGIIAAAPDESYDVKYRIWDEKIAEISFNINSRSYTLRAAVNGGMLFGYEESYEPGSDVFSVGGENGSGVATVRRTEDGVNIAVWKIGGVTFMLYSDDPNVTVPAFRQICLECGQLCSDMSPDITR